MLLSWRDREQSSRMSVKLEFEGRRLKERDLLREKVLKVFIGIALSIWLNTNFCLQRLKCHKTRKEQLPKKENVSDNCK